jgi:hypothetical protein
MLQLRALAKPSGLARQQLDRFVAEPVIGPAEGRTRWLLAMTDTAGPIVIASASEAIQKMQQRK